MIEVIVDGVDILKVVVIKVLDVFIGVVIEMLKKGDIVVLVGFGMFEICKCDVCNGWNL